jgi:F-type H+-transporting ATPase subunit b
VTPVVDPVSGPLAGVEVVQAANPLLEASPGLMIWTLVLFGITFIILKRYVFGPVSAAIEKRRAQIGAAIEEAERSREEAIRLLEEYRTRLAEARKEADELRERSRREAERQGQELLKEATQRRDQVLADTEVQIEAETRRALQELRDDVVDLALRAAEKVTRQTMTEADHRRLIEEALRDADLSEVKA